MTITAKYAGKCTQCGGAIEAGDVIAWSKTGGASHLKCDGAASVAVRSRRSSPRGRWSGCSCGSIDGHPRASDCAQCRFDSE
jgi:hypothetical protein